MSIKGLYVGSIFASGIAIWLTVSCVTGMRRDEAWCYDQYGNQPDALRYCLAQNRQAPAWAIGFGIWYSVGAFGLGYLIGRAFDRRPTA